MHKRIGVSGDHFGDGAFGIVDAEDVDRRASFRFTLDAGVALRFMGS